MESKQVKDTILKIVEVQRMNTVNLHWIKGHADHNGNELADYLAKKGNTLPVRVREPVLPIPYNKVKRAINAAFLEKWQQQWDALPGLVHSKLMLGERIDKLIG